MKREVKIYVYVNGYFDNDIAYQELVRDLIKPIAEKEANKRVIDINFLIPSFKRVSYDTAKTIEEKIKIEQWRKDSEELSRLKESLSHVKRSLGDV